MTVYCIEHGYIVDGVFMEKSKVGREIEPQDLLPLTPAVLHILLALADEERHGYGIMREVEGRTGGQTRLGPGTLYGSIKRMLADGLIEESDERPDPAMDDQRRRYYRITVFGRRVAGAEAERLSGLVETARARKLLPGRGRTLPEGV
jgi:DNA-binding PadR family transcriptional regulator